MTKRRIALMLAAGLAILGVMMIFRPLSGEGRVSPAEAQKMMEERKDVLFLDVRTPAEFSGPSGHLEGALLIPVQDLEDRIGELEQYRGKTIVAYCRTANRSGRAVALLKEHGFHALNMSGGIVQWNSEGRPVVQGEAQ
jgi:rhodanese-related sulfurtransferase